MSEAGQYVECCEHGQQQATYVCQHVVQSLRDGVPRGFWSAEAAPGDKRPDSWCSACEEMVNKTGGEWNDESEEFAGVKLLCGACYDRAKELNLGRAKRWWQVWR
jgi:hypothetical protein|tara:strand:- start:4532 stop:4846 length:315 start_codon:yes stop_codon:yes gene_type:complete